MKPFNLEEALKGAPVKLRNGCKAYVLANVKDLFPSAETEYPLIGVHSFSKDCDSFQDSENWTLTGFFEYCGDENGFDIVSMWEEPELTEAQILEKAYSENLKVTFDKAMFKTGYEVTAKTKDGEYILKSPAGLSLAKSYRGIKIYEEKPSASTVTVTLPRPFKPKPEDEAYFLRSHALGQLCVDYVKQAGNHYPFDDGNCFKSKNDAQAWLDAMKEAVDE